MLIEVVDEMITHAELSLMNLALSMLNYFFHER